MQRHEFDHLGAFVFSPEDGTPAATLPHAVSPAVMDDRRHRLMTAQQPIAQRKNTTQVGKVVDVLIEEEHPGSGLKIGRSARFAPEVDGVIYVEGSARLATIVPVQITAADVYDLHGRVASAADVFSGSSSS